MTDKKELIKNSIYKASLLIPLCLSLAVCGGLPSFYGLIIAFIGAIFLNITPETNLSPTLLLFLVLSYINSVIGREAILLCVLTGIIISLIILAVKPLKSKLEKSLLSGPVSLMTALFVTIFVTNSYFGIGASGNTLVEILKSYRSLGFHPNWRGILYGTIVMVVMITFPRKFKKRIKIISAPFYAFIITYILNLLLVPGNTVRTFAELGKPELNFKFDYSMLFRLSAINIVTIAVSGIAAGIIIANTIAVSGSSKKSIISACAANAGASIFGFPVVSSGNSNIKEYISGAVSAILIAAVTIPTMIFARLPVASAAVVLIVAGWQNLDKAAIKETFKKPIHIFGLIVGLAVSAVYSPAAGVIIIFLFSII